MSTPISIRIFLLAIGGFICGLQVAQGYINYTEADWVGLALNVFCIMVWGWLFWTIISDWLKGY